MKFFIFLWAPGHSLELYVDVDILDMLYAVSLLYLLTLVVLILLLLRHIFIRLLRISGISYSWMRCGLLKGDIHGLRLPEKLMKNII